jgi:DNA-binding transcriptional LysR family regulator
MELRDLRAFLAVVELGGMTRAARRLHVVQSAVSQAMKRLEQEYGLQLLERRSEGVVATPAGEALRRRARLIIAAAERLDAEMTAFRAHARGVVAIGVVSTLAPILIHRLVAAVDRELPDVSLRVTEGSANALIELLRIRRLDLVAVVSPVDTEELPFVTTGELELALIVAPGHALATRDRIDFAETSGERWIVFPRSNPGRRWLDDNARRAGFRPVIASEIDTLTQATAFVRAGHGVTLLPRETVELELAAGVLTAVGFANSTPRLAFGYVHDPARVRTSISEVRAVLESQLGTLPRG